MTMRFLLPLGTAAAALVAIQASAQDAPADPAPQAGRMRPMAETTRQQAEQRAMEMFARMDTNGDGRVDAAERAAGRPQGRYRPLPDGTGDQAASRADGANGTGSMTRDEFVARALAMFDRADADGDGIVTQEERRAARGQRTGRAGGPPPEIQ